MEVGGGWNDKLRANSLRFLSSILTCLDFLLMSCYGLNCPPTSHNSHVETVIPNMVVLGNKPLVGN